MVPSSHRRLLAALVLALVFAGCAGLVAPETDERAAEVRADLENATPPGGLEATRTTYVEIGDETSTIEEHVWLRGDGSSRTDGDDYLTVGDGERVWHHDRETDWATVLDTAGEESRLEGIYAEQERYFEEFEVTDVEKTTSDGREAYRVAFDPPRNETLERSIDVLVGETTYRIPLEADPDLPEETHAETVEIVFDAETSFPLEYRLVAEEAEFTVAYEDVSFTKPADDRFEFDPPETTDELVFPVVDEYDSVTEADQAVPFDVAEPSTETLPERVELDDVSSYEFPDENRTQVSLFYRSEEGTVSITTADRTRGYAADGDSITIDDAPGSIEHTDQGVELEWVCGGHHYSVFAHDTFGEETALEVAESVGCDAN